jgi:hypothetical protein
VLTPLAKAAGLSHGVAPALTTRLSALAARALPAPPEPGNVVDLRQGRAVEEMADRRAHPVLRRLRGWGSALNDRAARRLNQHTRPASGDR